MSIPVDKDIVGLNVTIESMINKHCLEVTRNGDMPMNETQTVDGFNRQATLCHIETRHILGEYLIFDEHSLC
jgi:hypothetical protein